MPSSRIGTIHLLSIFIFISIFTSVIERSKKYFLNVEVNEITEKIL